MNFHAGVFLFHLGTRKCSSVLGHGPDAVVEIRWNLSGVPEPLVIPPWNCLIWQHWASTRKLCYSHLNNTILVSILMLKYFFLWIWYGHIIKPCVISDEYDSRSSVTAILIRMMYDRKHSHPDRSVCIFFVLFAFNLVTKWCYWFPN